MERMFHEALVFNSDLSKWTTTIVENMGSMFSNAKKFNGDVSTWSMSNVISISNMFRYAESFNQNVEAWDVSNVDNGCSKNCHGMIGMFQMAIVFNQSRLPVHLIIHSYIVFFLGVPFLCSKYHFISLYRFGFLECRTCY